MMKNLLLPLLLTCLFFVSERVLCGFDQPKKIALLVGVSDYFDKNMEDLRYAENDVTVIGRELKNLGFDVTVLTGKNATKSKTDKQISAFLSSTEKLEKKDIVFIMFSGHGQELMAIQEKKFLVNGTVETIRQKAETPYFCPRDAKPFNPLRHSLTGKTEKEIADELNLISLNQVIGALGDRSNSIQNLFVVDACRNNPAKGKTANITGSTTKELPNGLSMLFAAKSGQKSWESSNLKIKHGVMSHFLIEGLKGKAATRKNEITWKRLVAFVSEEVEYDQGQIAGAEDRRQNPHAIGSSNLIVLGKLKALAKRLKNSVGMEFGLIPRGTFMMGSPDSEEDRDDDESQHEVTLSGDYYMGIYEVTQGQWKSVMGSEPWLEEGKPKRYVKVGADYAATYISWEEAVSYCKKLSTQEGKSYRLPTEAEWEYACRGGSGTAFSFGDKASALGGYGWFEGNADDIGEDYAHRVGMKKANGFGLHDMHGNVWEWCSDHYGDYPKSSVTDPVGPESVSNRVIRGGSWYGSPQLCRSAARSGYSPDDRGNGLGFRVVRSSE